MGFIIQLDVLRIYRYKVLYAFWLNEKWAQHHKLWKYSRKYKNFCIIVFILFYASLEWQFTGSYFYAPSTKLVLEYEWKIEILKIRINKNVYFKIKYKMCIACVYSVDLWLLIDGYLWSFVSDVNFIETRWHLIIVIDIAVILIVIIKTIVFHNVNYLMIITCLHHNIQMF